MTDVTDPNAAAATPPAGEPPAAPNAVSPPAAVVVPPANTATNPDPNAASAPPAGDGQGGAAKPGDPPAAAEGDPPAVVPYESFQLDEGFVLEGERLTTATTIFRELELSQDQAQKLISLYPKLAMEDAGLIQAQLEQQRTQQIEQWGADSKAEFGAGFETILSDAQAGIQWAKGERPNIIETFNKEGWGNNPDALWAFAQLGKLSRGSPMNGIGGGAPPAGKELSEGERMYQYADKPQGRKPE
jgi:hypothetical protein